MVSGVFSRFCFLFAVGLFVSVLHAAPANAEPPDLAHHDLKIELLPAVHRIIGLDAVRLTEPLASMTEIRFSLHRALTVSCPERGIVLEEIGSPENQSSAADRQVREYKLIRPREVNGSDPKVIQIIRLRYEGRIDHPVSVEQEEATRSFSSTVGTIGEEGVYLAGSTAWVPRFGDEMFTFNLSVTLPESWDAVSQGERTRHEIEGEKRQVVWSSPEPMEEVYLIAARFNEYSRQAGGVVAQAFLRTPDPNLAARYLEATAQYLEMYTKLLGPYPYRKFALVENFWETGYGMPSFTLLGPRIIRFPFILHSSYPHEILHNWWGNSVFVDSATGNWCEGLTAYLADHLVKEGQGQGAAYRRDTLKKYLDFVRGRRDFPLREFRSRHSPATEAVGYGKSLFLWHMIRREIGEEAFTGGLRRFYRKHRFKRASFDDLLAAFSEAAERDLTERFVPWIEREGAPELRLGAVNVEERPSGFEIRVEVEQIQSGSPYGLSVPVAITVEGSARTVTRYLDLNRRKGILQIALSSRPLAVKIDPEFDLFRRLDRREIPSSIGQIFGAEQMTLVLPGSEDSVSAARWSELARAWSVGREDTVRVVAAGALEELPKDRAVWVLGTSNPWARVLASGLREFDAGLSEEALTFGSSRVASDDHSFVFTTSHPGDLDLAVGWIGTDRPDAVPGLARKLPHYGKYSYLAFEGAEPTNVVKGQWPAVGSPLVRKLVEENVEAVSNPAREPLARTVPVFDPDRLLGHVERLASEEMEGRGVATRGIELAADYIAARFQEIGLAPGGDDGSFFQSWQETDGPGGSPVTLKNIVGVLPGSNDDWSDESVVLGAHYDHLGRGFPDVRKGNEGKIHPGADDNASGVSVLLEVATLLARQLRPKRALVFVAFSGEEWGLRGSRHYVREASLWPAEKALAMINLDTVGRLGDRKIAVLGAGSAMEWVHIFRGIGFTTGISSKSVNDDLGTSDQRSFLDAGIPAVQIFSGGHEDYHRPSDLAEKTDPHGMVKIATLVREALVYLSERDRPMTSSLVRGAGRKSRQLASSSRQVSLGTLPDFTYSGPGVKIESILDGTSAQAAGILANDLILSIDGEEIADLRGYSNFLKSRKPGDEIKILIRRDGRELTLNATLVAR